MHNHTAVAHVVTLTDMSSMLRLCRFKSDGMTFGRIVLQINKDGGQDVILCRKMQPTGHTVLTVQTVAVAIIVMIKDGKPRFLVTVLGFLD